MTEQFPSNQSDELVRLLRQRYDDEGDTISRKAADEIERLRAEVERLSRTLKEIAMRHCRCDRHDPTWLCSTCLAASALSPAAETPEQHKVDP